MRKISLVLSVIIIALLTQAMTCHKTKEAPTECSGDIACTMMFAMVTVDVKDNNGHPVILDEYYTIREKDGSKLTTQSPGIDSSTYTILDDNFIATLKNKTELFRFIGKKNGSEVVNEQYEISGDCCHINRVSGKTSITIP